MLISFILIAIALIGVSAFYSSTLFGCQSSGMSHLPPHYKHLAEPEKEVDKQAMQAEATRTPIRQTTD